MIVDKSILNPIAEYLEKELKRSLSLKNATGELQKSIEVAVSDVMDGFEISGSSLYYGPFVERGRKPGAKFIPIKALLDWVRIKKIKISGMSDESVAYMFQFSIKKKGIKPSLFVYGTLKTNDQKIKNDIEEALKKQVVSAVENMFLQIIQN